MRPTVLLIDAHPQPTDDKLRPYLDWLMPHFEITTVLVSRLVLEKIKADAVVVSGSEWQINRDPVPPVIIKICRGTQKPFLGICWGHQVLAHAWGARVIKKSFIETIETIQVTLPDRLLATMGSAFYAFESHYEHVVKDTTLLNNFQVLASSGSCAVEAIRHRQRPLWGVQFHLERSGEICKPIAANFAEIVKESIKNTSKKITTKITKKGN